MKLVLIIIIGFIGFEISAQIKYDGYNEFEKELDEILIKSFNEKIKSFTIKITKHNTPEKHLLLRNEYHFKMKNDSISDYKSKDYEYNFWTKSLLVKRDNKLLFYRKKFGAETESIIKNEFEYDSIGYKVCSIGFKLYENDTPKLYTRLRKYGIENKVREELLYYNDTLIHQLIQNDSVKIDREFMQNINFRTYKTVKTFLLDSNLTIDTVHLYQIYQTNIGFLKKSHSHDILKTYKSYNAAGKLVSIRRQYYHCFDDMDQCIADELWQVNIIYTMKK